MGGRGREVKGHRRLLAAAAWPCAAASAGPRVSRIAHLRQLPLLTSYHPPLPRPSPPLQTSAVQKQVKAVQAAFKHHGKKNETTPEEGGKLTIDTIKAGGGGWGGWGGCTERGCLLELALLALGCCPPPPSA